MIKITEYFIKNPRVTNMLILLILLSGIFSALTLRREQFPPMSFDIMQITTVYPGAAPEDVEINVTNKIEDQLREVENIKKLTSMSMENVSIILAQIDSDAGDTIKTKNDLRDAVGRVSNLPQSVTEKPVIDEIKATDMPVLEVALSGDISELELRKYAKELESRFQEVSGVSKIEKIGYRKREIKIDVNLNRMKKESISFAQIMNAIRSRNVRSTGGTINSYVSEKKILTLSEYDNLKDVKDVIIRSNYEGYNITVEDIATIKDDFEKSKIISRCNGKSAISLIVTQQENSDIINISKSLNQELKSFKKTLPKNANVDIVYDYSIFTSIMLDMVIYNGIFGFILVLIVMFLFLDTRSAFWCAAGIPFSIIGSFILFKIFNVNLHVISLATIILLLGIIVDDAIVVTENIYSLKQEGKDNFTACIVGTKKIIIPVAAAIFTTILAFAPINFIGGVMGKFTKSIPEVVTIVLLFSLFEAMFFIPAHLNHSTPVKKPTKKDQWFIIIKNYYEKVLLSALKRKKIVLSIFFALLFLFGYVAIANLNFMLDEDIDIDFFAIVIEAPQGTSLDKTKSIVPDIEKFVYDNIPPEALQSITCQIGHHNTQDFSASAGLYSNWAVVKIFLIPASKRNITSEEIMATMNKKLPDLKNNLQLNRLSIEPMAGLPIGKAVNIIYTSNDDSIRNKFEQETVDFLKTINGVSNIESTNVAGKNELQLKLNYKKLAQVGLTALDVADTVRTAFDGTVVTSIRKEGEDVDFRVRIKNPNDFRTDGILNLPIANQEGRLVVMDYFADIKEKEGTAVIHHYRGKRSVTISADVNTDIITSVQVNEKLRNKFEKLAAGISGLSMKLSGQEEETWESVRGVIFAFIVVVISIYFLLVIIFNSYKQPIMIMSIIPFAVVGAFLTLVIHGRPLIFISLLGIMGLIGVVVNDTIVMISHLNEICKEKGASIQTIVEGARDRFRPVILTTLTTFAGLLPTCYGIGGDLPTVRPLVLVMAWGLIFTTFVTLGFIPLLYSLVTGYRKN